MWCHKTIVTNFNSLTNWILIAVAFGFFFYGQFSGESQTFIQVPGLIASALWALRIFRKKSDDGKNW
jgi:hypothetical protein